MLPIEKNARTLVGVLVQHFPHGGICEDLRRAFEKETSLVAPQSFYAALKHCKQQNWLVGGGRGHSRQPYTLNPDGSWREPMPSIRETMEKEALDKDRLEYLVDSKSQQIDELQGELERLRDWSNGGDANGVNTALSSLLKIVADSGASVRQRIRASAAVLGYKTEGDITNFAKKYLTSVCESNDIAIDYKIESSELLRKYEAPRVVSETVKPSYSNDGTGASRTEAWRVYERWQLKMQIVIETHEVPPPGWDNHLQPDTYAGPPEGNSMPPVRVVEDAVSGFRLLDSLLPKKPYRIGQGSDDTSAS